VRIDADKVRKIQKEEYLRAGSAIQGVYNILKFAVADKEDALKEIEMHYERIEADKKRALKATREASLLKYDFDGSAMDLGNMADDVWTNFLAGTSASFEAVKAAEKKAEDDRLKNERQGKIYQTRKEQLLPYSDHVNISLLDYEDNEEEFQAFLKEARENKSAYDKEQEEILLENELLKEEQKKAEKKRLAEQKKQDAIREKEEAIREAERKDADAKLQSEREAREKLERENNERIAREKKASDIKAAELKKAENAPDIDKLKDMSNYLLGSLGTFKSDGATAAIRKSIDIINSAIQEI
jgi:hypothetical protein